MEDSIDIVDCFSMAFFDYHLDCCSYLFHRCGMLHDLHLCHYCNYLDHHQLHVDCLNCFGTTIGLGFQATVSQIHQLVVVDNRIANCSTGINFSDYKAYFDYIRRGHHGCPGRCWEHLQKTDSFVVSYIVLLVFN